MDRKILIRLGIYIGLTIIAAIIIASDPFFNWTGISELSLFQQYRAANDWWGLFTQVGMLSSIFFFGLILLFGFGKEKQKQDTEDSKSVTELQQTKGKK